MGQADGFFLWTLEDGGENQVHQMFTNSTYLSTQPTAVSRFYLQENDQNFKYQHCVLQEIFL